MKMGVDETDKSNLYIKYINIKFRENKGLLNIIIL